MPLVILCGFPGSGKTRRANELKTFIESNCHNSICQINDDDFVVDKNDTYADSKKEKELRGNLKSAVQRNIARDTVTILDSLNYIKGCRYELFCVSKAAQTPHCVIHCDISETVSSEWNSQRPTSEQYRKDVFDALVMRFEPPDSRNRWDSPLFLVHPDDQLPCKEIYDALFNRKPPPPNQSTQSQPLSSTNFLHELDKTTQATVSVLMDSQKTSVPGDRITIPGATEKIDLVRPLTMAELQRLRRQFITYTKMHPIDDTTRLSNMFIQFINNSIK